MSVYLTSNERALDALEYDRNRSVNTTSLLPSTCANVIRTNVATAQMLFRTEEGRHLTLSPRFHRYLDKLWTPFIRDCIDEILTLGILAIGYDVIRDDTDGTVVLAPYVIKGDLGRTYTITVGPDTSRVGRTRFRFYRLIDDRGFACMPTFDPRVQIFHGFGYDPNGEGRLRSIVSTIVWQERWISRKYFYTLRMEQTRSEGALYIESHQNIVQPVQTGDYYADGDQVRRQQEMYYRMTQTELEGLERARQAASVNTMLEVRQKTVGGNTGADSYDTRNGVNWFEDVGASYETPIVPIPDGRRVARVNAPTGGLQEWNDVNRTYQDYVCAAYGVPRSMIISDNARGSRDETGLVRSQFERTIDIWKRIVEHVLEHVYNELFGDDDADAMFADTILQVVRRKTRTAPTDRLRNQTPRSPIETHDWLNGAAAVRRELIQFRQSIRREADKIVTFTEGNDSKKQDDNDLARFEYIPTVEALTRMALPEIIKRLNELPDTASSDDPLFAAYADRLLALVYERSRRNRVKINYVSIPNVNNNDLFFMYTMGLIPWSEYEQLMRSANNLPIHPQGSKEPWSLDQRASMLRADKSDQLRKLGTASEDFFQTNDDDDHKESAKKKRKRSGDGDDDDGNKNKDDSEDDDDDDDNKDDSDRKKSKRNTLKKPNARALATTTSSSTKK